MDIPPCFFKKVQKDLKALEKEEIEGVKTLRSVFGNIYSYGSVTHEDQSIGFYFFNNISNKRVP